MSGKRPWTVDNDFPVHTITNNGSKIAKKIATEALVLLDNSKTPVFGQDERKKV